MNNIETPITDREVLVLFNYCGEIMNNIETPITDREVYTIKSCDIGFKAVNPTICRMLEKELILTRQAHLNEWKAAERLRKQCADLSARRTPWYMPAVEIFTGIAALAIIIIAVKYYIFAG